MTVKISNTLTRDVITNYRMPGKQGDRPNPVLSIRIQSRALLNDISFPSQEYYNIWKAQNRRLFDDGVLIEGKATEKQMIAENAKNVEKTNKRVKTRANKQVEAIQEAADKINAKVEFNEVSESSSGGKNAKGKN